MLGRKVFLVVSSDDRMPVESFSSEQAARSWSAEHSSRDFKVFDVTGVRECTLGDFHRGLVAAKERELDEMRKRLGVPR